MCYEKYLGALINMVKKSLCQILKHFGSPLHFSNGAQGYWNSIKWAEMVFVTSSFGEVELLVILMEKSSVHHEFP